ncbi:MAG: M15 family metallopeptidase [Bacteroidales bacterium]|nr:M15 family metallopeptidase [Bacteroidales bacterium]
MKRILAGAAAVLAAVVMALAAVAAVGSVVSCGRRAAGTTQEQARQEAKLERQAAKQAARKVEKAAKQAGRKAEKAASQAGTAAEEAEVLGRAVVTLSVCHVQTAPDYESALDNQFLMGRVVEMIGREGYWVQVRYPEGESMATGWVNELALAPMEEPALDAWLSSPRYICTAVFSHVYRQPSAQSDYLVGWVLGDIARQTLDDRGRPVRAGRFLGVTLPDGQQGYVPEDTAADFRQWAETREPTAENILATARQLLGSTYLWGGTSVQGVDCSGLVQLAFFMNGVLLPRNSGTQNRCGTEVWTAPEEGALPDAALVQPGDLLSFGTPAQDGNRERITHIALSLGGLEILQSSQLVRINTLEPGRPDTYARTPLHVRRLIPATPGLDAWRTVPGAALLKDSPLYFARPAEPVPEETLAGGADAFFRADTLSDAVFARMDGVSWKPGCPVPREELRYLRVLHRDASGAAYVGEMVVNQSIAQDVLEIFRALFDAGYPIEKMRLIDDYGGDDAASMAANNSSCFNYRPKAHNTAELSLHASGRAIDINPRYNPYVRVRADGTRLVEPPEAAPYADRSRPSPYRIERGDLCHRLFLEHGFRWGGGWASGPDYQHFEK